MPSTKRHIAIIGSRRFPYTQVEYEALKEMEDLEGIKEGIEVGRKMVRDFISRLGRDCVIVSGGAIGPDSWAAEFAEERGIVTKIFPAQWDKYGRTAGFKRNNDIISNSDDVVAFWDLVSRGTDDTLKKAVKAKKPFAVFGPDGRVVLHMREDDYA